MECQSTNYYFKSETKVDPTHKSESNPIVIIIGIDKEDEKCWKFKKWTKCYKHQHLALGTYISKWIIGCLMASNDGILEIPVTTSFYSLKLFILKIWIECWCRAFGLMWIQFKWMPSISICIVITLKGD